MTHTPCVLCSRRTEDAIQLETEQPAASRHPVLPFLALWHHQVATDLSVTRVTAVPAHSS